MYVYVYDTVIKKEFCDSFGPPHNQQSWEVCDELERGRIISTVEENKHYFSESIMRVNRMNILFSVAKSLSHWNFGKPFCDYDLGNMEWRYFHGAVEGKDRLTNKCIIISFNDDALKYFICFESIRRYKCFFVVKNYRLLDVDEKTNIDDIVQW